MDDIKTTCMVSQINNIKEMNFLRRLSGIDNLNVELGVIFYFELLFYIKICQICKNNILKRNNGDIIVPPDFLV